MIIHKPSTFRLWIRFEMMEAEKVQEQKKEDELTGRALVNRLFVEPLEIDGLRKNPKTKLAAHDEFRKRIGQRLSYMSADSLIRLRGTVLQLAEGPGRNLWPSFATVWNNAVAIQIPPDDENPIMRSWLLSIEGPKLRDAELLVEMYSRLRRNPRPPQAYDMSQMRERSAQNKRRLKMIDERKKAGIAGEEDLAWQSKYQRTLAHCLDLVTRGEVARSQTSEAAQ